MGRSGRNYLFPWLFAISLVLACGAPGEKADHNAGPADSIPVVDTASPPADTFGLAYLTGRFDPANHPDFTRIEDQYADRPGLYLRTDAYDAYKKMHAAADSAGIRLVIRSAARNFDYQKDIWERKWSGARRLSSGENAAQAFPDPVLRARKIMEYSAMPGASRHHWGTDIDLNAFNNKYFESGEGLKIFNWLTAHAAAYGFCRPYTAKGAGRPHGYNEEKWHWSYEPVARPLTEEARYYLKDELLTGFSGAEAAPEIGVVEKYVLGVSGACWE